MSPTSDPTRTSSSDRTATAPRLVEALRATARRLDAGAPYRWTHMGACNCGHLAQTVTRLSAAEIHRRALERDGDWTRQARRHGRPGGGHGRRDDARAPREIELCPATGTAMDDVFDALLALGLTRSDLRHLEALSDPRVLRRLPAGRRPLDKRSRADAVLYLRTWADRLEERWLEGLALPSVLSLPLEASPLAHRPRS